MRQPVSLDGDSKSCCFKCAGIFYGSCLVVVRVTRPALHALPVPLLASTLATVCESTNLACLLLLLVLLLKRWRAVH